MECYLIPGKWGPLTWVHRPGVGSGDLIEKLHMTHFPKVFNSEMDEDDLTKDLEASHDKRSDNKGSEPEGIAVRTRVPWNRQTVVAAIHAQ